MSINILWIYHFSGYRWTLKLFLIFYHSENVAMNIFLPVSISSALSNQRLEMFLWFLISTSTWLPKGTLPEQCICFILFLHGGFPVSKLHTVLGKKGQRGASSQQTLKYTIKPSTKCWNWVKRIIRMKTWALSILLYIVFNLVNISQIK